MRFRWVKALAPVLVLPFLAGCWDLKDIEERDIATLVIVDKTEEDGYTFWVEFAKPYHSGNSERASGRFAFRKGSGETLVAARRAIEEQLDHPLYLGADNAVIMTERFAREGIEEYMYRLRETKDYRKMVDILVTSDSPELFTKVLPEQTSVGISLALTANNMIDQDYIYSFQLPGILEALAGPCRCFLLPNVHVTENDVSISGFSVFRDGMLSGTIEYERARGVLLLLTDKPMMTYRIELEEAAATVTIKCGGHKTEPSYENGEIRFVVSARFTGQLEYLSNGLKIDDEQTERLSQALRSQVEEELMDAIWTAQKQFGADYIGFHEQFRIHYPVAFREMDWDERFPDAKVDVKVSIDLDTDGTLDYLPPGR